MRKLKIPTEPRQFTELELELIREIPYRKKLTGKIKKTMDRAMLVITLLELNGASKRGCRLSIHLLGEILGSNRTAEDVLKGFIEAGIVSRNDHYDVSKKLARKYKLTNKFKLVNLKKFVRPTTPGPNNFDALTLLTSASKCRIIFAKNRLPNGEKYGKNPPRKLQSRRLST